MTDRIYIKVLIPALLWFVSAVYSIGGQVNSAAYLKLGMDARGIALGRANIAFARGATAIYWNPAGLLRPDIPGKKFDVHATNLLNSQWDESYITTALAWRWKRFALGLGYIGFQVGDIPEYDVNMNFLGNFSNLEWTGLIGTAVDFPGLLTMGITGFYLSQEYRFAPTSNSLGFPIYGWGVNLGLQFNPIVQYERLQVGVLLNDQKSIGDQDTTSIVMDIGLRWDIWQNDSPFMQSGTFLVDFEQERDFPVKFKFGVELKAVDFATTQFWIRSGIDDIILEMRDIDQNFHTSREQIIRLNKKYMVGFGLQQQLFGSRTWLIVDYAWVKETFRMLHFITLKIAI